MELDMSKIDPKGICSRSPYYELHAEQDKLRADPTWNRLADTLTSVAAGRVVPMPEPHMEELLANGRAIEGKVEARRNGENNRCHLNASVRWLRNPREEIHTGYAFNGGMWRQHSWNVSGKRIIDKRGQEGEAYWGIKVATPVRFTLSQLTEYADEAAPDILGKIALRRLQKLIKDLPGEALLAL